jgi:plastocyanin
VAAGCGSSNDSNSTSSSAASNTASTPSTTTPAASNSGGGGGGASSSVKLAADPSGQLKFDKSSLSAKAGKVTIEMDNPSSIPHGIAVEGNGVDKDGQVVNKGGKSNVSVTLKKGTYTYYCPVPGHRQAGMEGKLTVQ